MSAESIPVPDDTSADPSADVDMHTGASEKPLPDAAPLSPTLTTEPVAEPPPEAKTAVLLTPTSAVAMTVEPPPLVRPERQGPVQADTPERTSSVSDLGRTAADLCLPTGADTTVDTGSDPSAMTGVPRAAPTADTSLPRAGTLPAAAPSGPSSPTGVEDATLLKESGPLVDLLDAYSDIHEIPVEDLECCLTALEALLNQRARLRTKAKAEKRSDLLKKYARESVMFNRHCLLYTSPSPRDQRGSRMPSSA